MICGVECKYKNARAYGYYDNGGKFRCFGPVANWSFDICDFKNMQRNRCCLDAHLENYVLARVASSGCHLEGGTGHDRYYWRQNLIVDVLRYCRDLKGFVPFGTVNSVMIENAVSMSLSALPKKIIEYKYIKGASVKSICTLLDMNEGTYYDIRDEAFLILYTVLRKYN